MFQNPCAGEGSDSLGERVFVVMFDDEETVSSETWAREVEGFKIVIFVWRIEKDDVPGS